jgi:CIC family chloride channel protein
VKSIIVKGGEVKITNLIGYTSPRPPLGIMAVVDRVRESFGLESWKSEVSVEDIQVMHAMRKNVKALNIRANFPEILKFIDYSNYNTFPLVNDNNLFEGVISFQEIRGIVYDESLTQLVIAKDFARHKDMFVLPDDSMEVALQTFENNKVDCLPVVNSMEEKTLVGMLEQKDVVKIIMQKRLQNESP